MSWSSKLRRYLIEHRFNAAQGAFGLIALSVGLALLWPTPPDATVDHHGLWQRSLQTVGGSFDGRDDAVRDGLLPVTEASKAVSAKGEVEGLSGGRRPSLRERGSPRSQGSPGSCRRSGCRAARRSGALTRRSGA